MRVEIDYDFSCMYVRFFSHTIVCGRLLCCFDRKSDRYKTNYNLTSAAQTFSVDRTDFDINK